MSVTALVGDDAQFNCTGNGMYIEWKVDGLYATDINIIDREIRRKPLPSPGPGIVRAALTVPATSANNGSIVQCKVFPASVTSNNATLTVLPGELCWTDTID